MGDLVIVTLEGDDPVQAFARMLGAKDEFTTWFMERAQALHGVDLTAPLPGPLPELLLDTAEGAAAAG
jgi:hypothetical protein